MMMLTQGQLNMMTNIKSSISRYLVHLLGWRTDRKIVVIESDDWGMTRMRSKRAYEWFLEKGYRVDQCPYNRNDTMESNEDLELLFNVLHRVRDKHGHAAVITANNVVANPDFEKIKESDFQQYYYEPFTETLKRYAGRDGVVDLYREGITNHIFRPQFHSREHLNINRWMQELNAGSRLLHDAFDRQMFTVHHSGSINGRRDNLDAFGMGYGHEWVSMKEIVQTGLNLFEGLWGYSSQSFIAPCYIWGPALEDLLAERGIRYIQGTHVQRVPCSDGTTGIKKKYHYLGHGNRAGQRYLVRNVHFEPTERGRGGSVDRALKEIAFAFEHKKPAIISSHRVNYVGSIRAENRNANLKLLGQLLERMVKAFPDIEFMSSDQLGNLITEDS